MDKIKEQLAELYVQHLVESYPASVVKLVEEAYLTAFSHALWVRESELEAKHYRNHRRDITAYSCVFFGFGLVLGGLLTK